MTGTILVVVGFPYEVPLDLAILVPQQDRNARQSRHFCAQRRVSHKLTPGRHRDGGANEGKSMFELEGRVALVTGAASGIGAATARVFAEAGASVALAWFPGDGHDVQPVRAAVEAYGARCLVAEVDVRESAQVDVLVERTMSEFGGLDIVVANAGIARKVALEDLNDDAWKLVLDVDLNGAWRCFRAALPHMRRAGYGRLLATSSIAGTVQAWPQHPHYAGAKAGLVGLV